MADLERSGGLETAAGRFQDDLHADAKPGQHINDRVRAEKIDPPSQEIAHTGLRYTEDLSRLSLP